MRQPRFPIPGSTRNLPAALLRPTVLIVSDIAALALSLAFAVLVKAHNSDAVTFAPYLKLWPFTLVFLVSYWMSGLYSRPALSQPEDLQRGTACSCCIFLTLSAFTLTLRGGSHYFTFTLAITIVANALLMPLLRELARHLFSGTPGWGHQAVIFGSGAEACALIERSLRERESEINPVAIVDPDCQSEPFMCGLPITSSIREAAGYINPSMAAYGLLTVAAASSAEIVRLVQSPESLIFSRIILVSNPSAMSSMWAMPLSRRSMLRLSARSRLDGLTYRIAKRAVDVSLSGLALVLSLPVMAALAISIKLDSPGPVFFRHQRIGKNEKPFYAWKFRTMQQNANTYLTTWLAEHPAAKEEWDATGKLQKDPRVTRVGRVLRISSLDELPQLWNVLIGEMSLVGPRPIVQEEVCRYGQDYGLYSQAHGGVTGLWQVSGRSSTSYSERVMLDSFYVKNWTIWLDLAIILRTIGAVLLRKGAV